VRFIKHIFKTFFCLKICERYGASSKVGFLAHPVDLIPGKNQALTTSILPDKTVWQWHDRLFSNEV